MTTFYQFFLYFSKLLASTYPWSVYLIMLIGVIFIFLAGVGGMVRVGSREGGKLKNFDSIFLNSLPVEYTEEYGEDENIKSLDDPIVKDIYQVLEAWRRTYPEYRKDKVQLKMLLTKKMFDILEVEKERKEVEKK